MNGLPEIAPREWIERADEDRRAAEQLLATESECFSVICFHAQQAAEKYIKAALAAKEMDVPHIHDLARLMQLFENENDRSFGAYESLIWLTGFAVNARYPRFGSPVNRRNAVKALEMSAQIIKFCLERISLEPETKPNN